MFFVFNLKKKQETFGTQNVLENKHHEKYI